jgi:hypothetical protein
VGYFMQIGDQEGEWIKIAIDGNAVFFVRIFIAVVSQLGFSFFGDFKIKRKNFPEGNTIVNGRIGKVLLKYRPDHVQR